MAKEKVNRRLAAVFAADMVGYSRLMEADEEGTIARQKTHRQELIDPRIAEYEGRIVKTTGDGILVEFASVVDAVQCAAEIQRTMQDREAKVSADRRIRYRVGINLGDIVIDGDDIFGDGVNLAARLEAIADPGGICISGDVYRQVRSKLDLDFQDLGEHKVKNIAEPVHAYRIHLEGVEPTASDTPEPDQPSLTTPDKASIAVLPFANMSGDVEQEYFSDGITEDIITGLSMNRSFFVISRSTSFKFKGQSVDVRQAAQELGVRYVLEGSVRKAGNRVRITAQLIDATTDHHVWAERYDRELQDIFDVQDEITQNIIGSIAPGIMSAEIQRAQRKDPRQLDSWDRTMRAHWHIRRFTKEDNEEARRLLSEAIELDPGNAMALGDLAFASHFEAIFGWSEDPADSWARLGDAGRKAVEADDHDAFAHTALAIHELFTNRHEDAVRRLERAIDLNPNLAFARGYLGAVYCFSGERELAMKNIEQAIRLSPRDPLMVIWHVVMSWASYCADRYEEAAEFAKQAIQDNSEFVDNYTLLAASYGQLGRPEDARSALEELMRRLPDLTITDIRLERPFKRPADKERLHEGLRKAGLPE